MWRVVLFAVVIEDSSENISDLLVCRTEPEGAHSYLEDQQFDTSQPRITFAEFCQVFGASSNEAHERAEMYNLRSSECPRVHISPKETSI